jgi:hypothetical protein
MRRDRASGAILAIVDTDALTNEERVAVSEALHELVVESKCREALVITDRGIDAQVEYLAAQRGEDAMTDMILDALDAVDKWKAWK